MGIFQKHTMVLGLAGLVCKQGSEVKGLLSFDFGPDQIKADKITISLIHEKTRRTVSSNVRVGSGSVGGGKSYSSSSTRSIILTQSIAGVGDYRKEKYPISFIVPEDLLADKIPFEPLLQKIPEQYRDTARSILNILESIFLQRPKHTFKVEARMDIPWGVDVVSSVNLKVI